MSVKIEIKAVSISREKGTIKSPVPEIRLTDHGIEGDAHAGKWHRQVSLLGTESLGKMKVSLGRIPAYGEFAENITTEGYELFTLKPLDLLVSGEVVLEVTQIGKKCHGECCAIFKETGDCVMPREGIFARVLQSGILKAGDVLEIHPRILQVKIITLSDRASEGVYEDRSGPLVKKFVEDYFKENGRSCNCEVHVIPDEADQLSDLIHRAVNGGADLIFTTGGTGIGPRDITPDVLKSMFDKEITGIMELIRVKYGMQLPNALISRSVAGVIGQSLVYALPGSTRAVKEYMDEILKTIEHSLRMLHQIDSH